MSAEQARRKAAVLIASIKAGEEPGRNGVVSPSATGPTLAEVAERYMREHVAVRCKLTTAGAYRYALDTFLLPAFGSLPLGGIGRDQVAALHYRLHKTPSMVNRVVETLSRLFYMAEAWGVAPEGGNPCRFVKKYKDRSCERFRNGSSADWEAYGASWKPRARFQRALSRRSVRPVTASSTASLDARFPPQETDVLPRWRAGIQTEVNNDAIRDALWFGLYAGMRREEVLTLRWDRVEMDTLSFLVDETKTGVPLELPITPQLAGVLERRRIANADLPNRLRDWVFPSGTTAPTDFRQYGALRAVSSLYVPAGGL